MEVNTAIMMTRFANPPAHDIVISISGEFISEDPADLALKLNSSQPLLIPLNDDIVDEVASRITVHIAISELELEKATLSLLGRNARFSVVKGSIGYAAVSDVRIIDEAPDIDQQRVLDEEAPPKLLYIGRDRSKESMLEAVRAGAWAYVSEREDAEDLQNAVCSLVESPGSSLLKQIASSDEGAAMLLDWISATREPVDDFVEVPNPLTENEIRILDLVARGEPSKVIGATVGLGEQTIKNYVVTILGKTHTHNRAHAAALAAQRGWLSPLNGIE